LFDGLVPRPGGPGGVEIGAQLGELLVAVGLVAVGAQRQALER
jgi:hypothetical protein